jgi:deazaflavin-dependent oxidoreductase (nitroreductase family)
MKPDPTHTVLVAERAVADQDASVEEMLAELERRGWPPNLVSFDAFGSTDGETVLVYTQWQDGEVDAGVLGGEPVEYRLYRSAMREDPPTTGCVVVVRVEFDGPDEQRQRRWVDTVFDALAQETDPPAGGISGHFHVGTDGIRVLNVAEWTDEQAHRDALARSGQGTVGVSPGWRRVLEFRGVKESGFRRYRFLGGRSAPVDSPTDWVAEHIRRYVETDGRDGHLYQGWPTLLLTTRGRRSGQPRRTALIYGQDGDRYLVVGSNAGAARDPAWYRNLVEHPEIDVQVGADKFTARARTATAEEKPLLWQRMAAIFPLYDEYQSRAERDIPVVIIERLPGDAA